MTKLRVNLNAGCGLFMGSWVVLDLVSRPVDSVVHQIALAGLQMTPAAVKAIDAIVLSLLGPLILGGLIYLGRRLGPHTNPVRTVSKADSGWAGQVALPIGSRYGSGYSRKSSRHRRGRGLSPALELYSRWEAGAI